ncbi:MmpS family transport accessory protein [Mycolicibacterium sarraceniae]|uniref:MmpS family transport accessory protein n=1 Tax=Mycolicibacterium sarraceniae TaxID=1534348 RepID=UPI0013D0E614|nr:MmpS family transport accessory protein [Mycolicibacterium sarraceniae]
MARLWIPLLIAAVIGAGGFTVSRLHGVFGAETSTPYSDTKVNPGKPYNPKHIRYEIFGAPGTLAEISFFNGDGDPEHQVDVALPWSFEFPLTTTGSIGSVAAQGDSDMIGCRIMIDGKVKSEKITNEASAFASCVLKAA